MMPKVTIELEYEQIDAITLGELKQCYEQLVKDWENNVAVFDNRDDHWDLLFGFEKVIQYFSEPRAFDDYMAFFPLREKD
jgi:hypothetical protein